jgi:hypothetical protein
MTGEAHIFASRPPDQWGARKSVGSHGADCVKQSQCDRRGTVRTAHPALGVTNKANLFCRTSGGHSSPCQTKPISPGQAGGADIRWRPVQTKPISRAGTRGSARRTKQDAPDRSRDRPNRSPVLAWKRGPDADSATFVVGVKQSQTWAGWGIRGRSNVTRGPVPPQSGPYETKPIRSGTGRRLEARDRRDCIGDRVKQSRFRGRSLPDNLGERGCSPCRPKGMVQRRVSQGNTRTTYNQNCDCRKSLCCNSLPSLLHGFGRRGLPPRSESWL